MSPENSAPGAQTVPDQRLTISCRGKVGEFVHFYRSLPFSQIFISALLLLSALMLISMMAQICILAAVRIFCEDIFVSAS